MKLNAAPLAPISRFHSLITVPQVAIFTVFAFIAVADSGANAELWLALTALAYLLASDLFVRGRVRAFSVRFMAIYLSGLALLLGAMTVFGHLSVDQNLLLPTALIILSTGRINAGTNAVLMMVTPPLLISAVLAALALGSDAGTSLVAPEVAFFVEFLALLLVLTIARRHRELAAITRYPTPLAGTFPKDLSRPQSANFSFSAPLGAELRSEFGWRLPIIALISVALVFSAAYAQGLQRVEFHLSLLSVVLVQIVLYHLLLSAPGIGRLFNTALIFFLTLLLLWALVPTFGVGPELLPELLLAVLILAFGLLPWSTGYLILGGTVLALIIGFRAAIAFQPMLVLVIGIGFLVVALRLSAVSYLTVISRVTSFLAAELSRERRTPLELAKLSAAQLTALCHSDKALFFAENQPVEIVGEALQKICPAGSVEHEILLRALSEYPGDQGIVTVDRFSERLRALLIETFDYVPPAFIFVRYSLVGPEASESGVALYPYSFASWIAGEARVLQAVVGAVSTIRAVLDTRALDVRSSQALSVSRERESLRVSEFNQVVHHVNNVAQDVYAACEALRRELKDGPRVKEGDSLTSAFSSLESAVHALASGVTDAKVMQELVDGKSTGKSEVINVEAAIEELTPLGAYWAARSGAKFVAKVENGVSVSVLNREFFLAVLHLLVRTACRHAKSGSIIELSTTRVAEWGTISVKYSGTRLAEERLQVDVSEGASESVDTGARSKLSAVKHFAELSRGRYEFRAGINDPHELRLNLPLGGATEVSPPGDSAWALIVDDSEDLTVFYARVVEALQLRAEIAASAAAAKALTVKCGAPAIALVDLFLDDGSGIEVVEFLRRDFGANFPIFVITGYDDSGLQEKALKSGASKFLLKPINRRQLHDEIQSALGVTLTGPEHKG